MTNLENKQGSGKCALNRKMSNYRLVTILELPLRSATTGGLSDNHDIISFKSYELEPIADASLNKKNIEEYL